MAVAWSRDEILKLIELWGDSAQPEGCKRNQDIFDKIATDLRDASFERTGKQCREKIKKLKGEYRKVKDKRNKLVQKDSQSGTILTRWMRSLVTDQQRSHLLL